jgi:hypothetical protein
MNSKGEIAIINEPSGVEFVGAWLSNTYAWSTHKFGFKTTYYNPTAVNSTGWSGSTYNYHGYYEDEDFEGYGKVGKSYPVSEVKTKVDEKPAEITAEQVKPYVRACFNQFERKGLSGILQWVNDAPHKAAALLNYWYDDCDFIEDLVYDQPDEAAEWLMDLFKTDSIAPSLYQ